MNKPNKSKTTGLGSGLSSLLGKQSEISSFPLDNNNSEKYNLIPIEFIEPGPWQPRKDFDKIELEALANSIKNQGVIQPIIVKKKQDTKNHYHLIAGEKKVESFTNCQNS